MLRKLTEDELEFEIQIEPEDEHPIKCFDTGDAEEDKRMVQEILEAVEWNPWAWCSVKVRAVWRGFEGDWDYLGCCSYESEEDFKQPGGYYDGMKAEALESLNQLLADHYEDLSELRELEVK